MIYDFFACILGVRAAAPGWSRIRIQPQVTASASAQGELRVPSGLIQVRWTRNQGGEVKLEANTPVGVPVALGLPGGIEQTFPEGGVISVTFDGAVAVGM